MCARLRVAPTLLCGSEVSGVLCFFLLLTPAAESIKFPSTSLWSQMERSPGREFRCDLCSVGGRRVMVMMKGLLPLQLLWLLLSFHSTAGADILRLVDGGSPCAGRVEVKHQDQWGMVCDDDETERQYHSVICKQLVCGSPVATSEALIFGEHSGLTWLTEVICHGNESALWDCKHGGWELKSCPYAAGVLCSGHIKSRLVGGDSICSGRVEIEHGETWVTVCDADFDLKAASVICSELNCGAVVSILGGAHFKEGDGPIWNETLQCAGNES
ncbi:unnamed protein product [Natator depressus]